MTINERAEKIQKDMGLETFHFTTIIAAQISDAVKECANHLAQIHNDDKKVWMKAAFDAYEDAAKICDARAEMRDKCECDCRGYTRSSEHNAEEIRALKEITK